MGNWVVFFFFFLNIFPSDIGATCFFSQKINLLLKRSADHPKCRREREWTIEEIHILQELHRFFAHVCYSIITFGPDQCILLVKMALVHHKSYNDDTTEDSCIRVLAERVKDLLPQGSGRPTIRGADHKLSTASRRPEENKHQRHTPLCQHLRATRANVTRASVSQASTF